MAGIITVTVASGTPVISVSIDIKSIRWVKATTAGHEVRIEAPNGDLLWRSVAGGSNNVEESITSRHWPNGFAVVTLQSGELDIEREPSGPTAY